ASDYELSGLSQGELERIQVGRGEIEDIYAVTPMQAGMLFHTLMQGTNSGVYCDQVVCRLRGELNREAFAAAWRAVVRRHEALRASFEWEGLRQAVQVISREAEVAIEWQDWRGLSADEQAARLERELEEDRRRGFELRRAPLMRLLVARLEEEGYEVVWDRHHLLMDGWCMPVVLSEVLRLYEASCEGKAARLEPARRY